MIILPPLRTERRVTGRPVGSRNKKGRIESGFEKKAREAAFEKARLNNVRIVSCSICDAEFKWGHTKSSQACPKHPKHEEWLAKQGKIQKRTPVVIIELGSEEEVEEQEDDELEGLFDPELSLPPSTGQQEEEEKPTSSAEEDDEEYKIELQREELTDGRAVPAYLLKTTSSGQLVQPEELALGGQLQAEPTELNQHGILFYPDRPSRSRQPKDIYTILADEDLRKEAREFAQKEFPNLPQQQQRSSGRHRDMKQEEVNKKRKRVEDAKYEELIEQSRQDKEATEATLRRHRERWGKKK
jgi:hypothetical protein